MNSNEIRPSTEVQAALDAALKESKSLGAEATQLEAKLKLVRSRTNELWRLTDRLRSELEDAKKIEDLRSKPPVVWKQTDRWTTGRSYVVVKVTPKQIRVSTISAMARVDLFTHDGIAVSSSDNVIDIEKTFPDGLKVSK